MKKSEKIDMPTFIEDGFRYWLKIKYPTKTKKFKIIRATFNPILVPEEKRDNFNSDEIIEKLEEHEDFIMFDQETQDFITVNFPSIISYKIVDDNIEIPNE